MSDHLTCSIRPNKLNYSAISENETSICLNEKGEADSSVAENSFTPFQPAPLQSRTSSLSFASRLLAPSLKIPVRQKKLANGLTIYSSPNSSSTDVRVKVFYKVGSKNESPEHTGLVHLLEHMLFKGTSKVGTTNYKEEKPLLTKIQQNFDEMNRLQCFNKEEKNLPLCKSLQTETNSLSTKASEYVIGNELRMIYSDMGASDVNATTSYDYTNYEVTLPERDLSTFEKWAKTASHALDDAEVIRLLQIQMEAVYEEYNQRNTKNGIMWSHLYNLLFPDHPYGRPIMGIPEHLKSPSASEMKKFFHQYYHPENMMVAISGNIDMNQAEALIEKYFGQLKKQEIPQENLPPPPMIKGIQKKEFFFPGQERVNIGFRTIPFSSKDRAAVWMVAHLLYDPPSFGKIAQQLTSRQKILSGAVYNASLKEGGILSIYGLNNEGQKLEDVEKLLLEMVEEIKRGDFSEKEMKAAISNYERIALTESESNDARTDQLGNSFIHGISLNYTDNFFQQLKKLTKKDVIKAAKEYLGGDYAVVYSRNGERKDKVIFEKPQLGKVELNRNNKSEFAKKIQQMPASQLTLQKIRYGHKDGIQFASIAPGVVLHYMRNPANKLSDLSIIYEYGNSDQDKAFCNVMGELKDAGIHSKKMKLSSEEVQKRFHSMGVVSSYKCSNHYFEINLNGLNRNFFEAFKLSEKRLWEADFNEDHFKTRIQQTLQNRENAKKDSDTIADALYQYVLFKKNSTYLNRSLPADLLSLSGQEDYKKRRDKLLTQNFIVSYVGNEPIWKVANWVRRIHQPTSLVTPLLTAERNPPVKYQLSSSHIKIYFTHDPSEQQAKIQFILPESDYQNDPRKSALHYLLNTYLGKQGSDVLFQQIRETKGFAYSLSSQYYEGERVGDQDLFSVDLSTQEDKTVDAVSLLNTLLQNLSAPLSSQEFERNKRNLDKDYNTGHTGFRNVIPSVIRWAKRGYPYGIDPRSLWINELKTIGLQEFKAFIRKTIETKNPTITIVGDRKRVNLEALSKIAPVEEVQLDQLFSQ